ncbi:MAG: transglycosylase domain-containing protein [Mobilitalea sp.]
MSNNNINNRKNIDSKNTDSKNIIKKRKNRIGQGFKLALQLLSLLILLTVLIGMIYFYHTYGKTILRLQAEAKQMVNHSTEETFKSSQTTLLYDTQGNLISTLKAEKDVYYIKINDIPQAVIDAVVVSEDRKFLEHDGVDYIANIRAAIALIEHKGSITQGASTITQQLARNVFLTHEVTYERKIEEIFAAQELEKKYNKSEIMEYYLNGIYFANGHYGIQAAAQGYFAEGIKSLSLSQIAFLCAIPNNPTLYNPLTNMDNTVNRRDRILLQLLDDGKITSDQYKEATAETITLIATASDKKDYVETYAYHSAIEALMAEQNFEFRYQFESEKEQQAYEAEYNELYYSYQKDLYTKGYRIYTSIDLKKQELLQKSVDDALAGFTKVNDEGIYKMQGAAVCIDNDNGRVVAIVGGREQELDGYTLNRGYQSYRQPGSAIKPLIVYTPSFERDYTPESIVVDEKTEDGPKNSGGSYLGEIKLQRAIELSKNTIAWKLFEELSPKVGLSYLLKMNFAKISSSDYVPSASLGGFTNGVSPLEIAAGYAALANDGYYRTPTCIVKIMNSQGEEIVGENKAELSVYDTNAARIMTEALTGVIKNGTGMGLGLTNTISAGKTGTTNDKKDGWFVGYTPYYTSSVWVGYDLPQAVKDLTGASYPGTIWHNFMEGIHGSSMTDTFALYDWRTPLKEAQASADKLAKEEELKEQEAQDAIEAQEAEDRELQEAQEAEELLDLETQEEDTISEEEEAQDGEEVADPEDDYEEGNSGANYSEDDIIDEEPTEEEQVVEEPITDETVTDETAIDETITDETITEDPEVVE